MEPKGKDTVNSQLCCSVSASYQSDLRQVLESDFQVPCLQRELATLASQYS